MSFVPIEFVNGQVMTWAGIQQNLDDARAWLHDIPVEEVTASTVRREHLIRPRIGGFPTDGLEGEFQGIWQMSLGLGRADCLYREEWGSNPDRLTIIPVQNDGVNQVWRLPVGRTVYAPVEVCACVVHCSFDLQARNAYTGPYYPQGASGSGEEMGGHFQVHVFNRNDEDETQHTHSIRQVYPLMYATVGPPVGSNHPWTDKVQMTAAFQIDGGHHYDVGVVYHQRTNNDEASEDLHQFDLTRIQFVLEMLGGDPS